ncbi:electron transporter RnfG [Kosmotoga arenicorallina S304]|uniref:Ion-translocating oxidoreductase complex subunit G n=1 Tax=Kosmotoga arenicorallina S304 TaxID=1453497 RepID=A0A176K1E7_9BACT|nr:RnfABCDGE type electron transport complex subunit G [Kosmotoga arenicorallina]OAA30972.1 electron transporter RnfG [Kosmotoga arenicorallina S304]
MREYFKMGFVLMIITIIAGLGLALVYSLVKEPIEKAELAAKIDAIRFVLTDSTTGKLLIPENEIPKDRTTLAKYEWTPMPSEEGIMFSSTTWKGKVQSPGYIFETKDGAKIYVLTGQAVGYGGNVVSVAAFLSTPQGLKLNAIKVMEYSQETPGLGANIARDDIQKRFYPISSEGLEKGIKVNKDAGIIVPPDEYQQARDTNGVVQTSDVMTGATITPRAVVNSINTMYEFLKKAGVK